MKEKETETPGFDWTPDLYVAMVKWNESCSSLAKLESALAQLAVDMLKYFSQYSCCSSLGQAGEPSVCPALEVSWEEERLRWHGLLKWFVTSDELSPAVALLLVAPGLPNLKLTQLHLREL